MPDLAAARVPRGRLARLGVVLDADDRAAALARLCDRAGIDIVWLADRTALPDDVWPDPAAIIVRDVVGELERAALGVFVGDPGRAVGLLPARGTEAPPFELAWPHGGELDGSDGSDGSDGPDRTRLSVVVRSMAGVPAALGYADDIVLAAWHFPDLEAAADEVRAEALEAGRAVDTLGVAALLPVSIGRTEAEAEARVVADPVFGRIGHPAENGIFGTLEACQDRVIALAHAGITDLRCVVPATHDAHDVIAQLTSITVGTTDVLIPGSLRSPSPPPPDGWGGRSPVSDRSRISGGSRRR